MHILHVLNCHFVASPVKVRDWSLITGRGGGYKTVEWGSREIFPLQKGDGVNIILAMLN